MPYLITTKRPCPACVHGPAAGGEHRPESVSRRAVATLGGREIWNALYGVEIARREDVVDEIAALPESGGKVGPLPDGTLIEVEQIAAHALARQCDDPELLALALRAGDSPGIPLVAGCVAAFNGKQATS